MINSNIKVILSTFGPLHLIKSAEFLSKFVEIKVIQGWIPTRWNKWMLKPISKIIGYDLSKTIKKRTPDCLKHRNIGLMIPDFFDNFVRFFIKNSAKRSKYAATICKLYGWESSSYIKEGNIFHVRSGSGRGGAIKKARKKGMKIIVDHSIAHPSFMEKQLRNEYERNHEIFNLGPHDAFWNQVLNDCLEADILLVNSTFVKETFVAEGYRDDKIAIAYLGVREDFFSLKTSYSISKKVKILFTGGFNFRKGAEYCLKAMQKLEQLGIDYEFTVVGNYEGAKELIKDIPIKGLNLVGFIPQDELKSYLTKSDIYLFPSLCEGCASSGMEALAAGLPVIATRESGFPIENNKNGIIIESKNERIIAEKIIYLINNKEIRKDLGQAAAKLIREKYTWEKYASTVVHNVYEKVISE